MKKEAVVSQIEQLLKTRIEESQSRIAELQVAKNSDSKSTAGDKHETGRAMVQAEVDRANEQLAKACEMLAGFGQIEFSQKRSKATIGSLVKAGSQMFLLSVGLGKVLVDDKEVLVISAASPVGQNLIGKARGDSFNLGPSTLIIDDIS